MYICYVAKPPRFFQSQCPGVSPRKFFERREGLGERVDKCAIYSSTYGYFN